MQLFSLLYLLCLCSLSTSTGNIDSTTNKVTTIPLRTTPKAVIPKKCQEIIYFYREIINVSPMVFTSQDQVRAAFRPKTPNWEVIGHMERFLAEEANLAERLEGLLKTSKNVKMQQKSNETLSTITKANSLVFNVTKNLKSKKKVETATVDRLWDVVVLTDRLNRIVLRGYCGWDAFFETMINDTVKP